MDWLFRKSVTVAAYVDADGLLRVLDTDEALRRATREERRLSHRPTGTSMIRVDVPVAFLKKVAPQAWQEISDGHRV